jgi:hypothetical protein
MPKPVLRAFSSMRGQRIDPCHRCTFAVFRQWLRRLRPPVLPIKKLISMI